MNEKEAITNILQLEGAIKAGMNLSDALKIAYELGYQDGLKDADDLSEGLAAI
jgi:hypothetical protein